MIMDQSVMNKYEEKGLALPFNVSRAGETVVASSGESLKSKISQTGTVIFETIGAVGGIKIDALEIIGSSRGMIMEINDEVIFGSLFDNPEGVSIRNLWHLLGELRSHKEAAAKAEEKPKAALPANTLDTIKAVMKDYLGDFTDRIYQNQLKSQRIKPEELYEEDARRFIFALGKAAGMIIGPSKGKDLTNKLLAKIK
jgi:hypothetical protein